MGFVKEQIVECRALIQVLNLHQGGEELGERCEVEILVSYLLLRLQKTIKTQGFRCAKTCAPRLCYKSSRCACLGRLFPGVLPIEAGIAKAKTSGDFSCAAAAYTNTAWSGAAKQIAHCCKARAMQLRSRLTCS